jgi:hypothetical protein
LQNRLSTSEFNLNSGVSDLGAGRGVVQLCGTHAWLLRADRALPALLGMMRFPTEGTIGNLFKRITQGMLVRFFEPVSAWIAAAMRGFRSEREGRRVEEWRA